MLDLELLNLWINRLYFDIRGQTLYLSLKAFSDDPCYSYVLPLSSDRPRILEFFGFDTSRDYDHMTTFNQFEYLCSSSKLDPKYISYFSFKGPGPKNQSEAKFEKYLVSKRYPRFQYDSVEYAELHKHRVSLKKEGVSFFEKEAKYQRYLEQRKMLNSVIAVKNKLEGGKVLYGEFSKFLILHGMYNVLAWDVQTLEEKWLSFKTDNWSGLLVFRTA